MTKCTVSKTGEHYYVNDRQFDLLDPLIERCAYCSLLKSTIESQEQVQNKINPGSVEPQEQAKAKQKNNRIILDCKKQDCTHAMHQMLIPQEQAEGQKFLDDVARRHNKEWSKSYWENGGRVEPMQDDLNLCKICNKMTHHEEKDCPTKLVSTSNQLASTKAKGWEDEYNLLFNDCEVVHVYETKQFVDIKEFIRNLLSSQKRELAEKFQDNCYCTGGNGYADDLLEEENNE